MRARSIATGLGLFAGVVLAALPSSADPLRTLVRFGPPPGSPQTPSVMIGESRRSVLEPPAYGPLSFESAEWKPVEQDRAHVRARVVDPSIPVGAYVEIEAKIRIRKQVRELPLQIRPVQQEDGQRVVEFTLEHAWFASARVRSGKSLELRARRVSIDPALSSETKAVAVAPGSQIVFAYGFVSAQPDERETQIRVQACRGVHCSVIFEESAPVQTAEWVDQRVPLSVDRPRETLSFRFEAIRRDGRPRTDYPVFSVARLVGPGPTPDGEHDLLLISVDTLRADFLSGYGYPRATSPFIDRFLAARGTVFENALSTATTTAPSHMSMFTSLPPAVHGVHTNFTRALPGGTPVLAEQLRSRGFATAAFTENGPMTASRGFDRGFDSFFENRRRGRQKDEGHIEETLARGARWLRENREQRRFLFLHSFQVHTPYTPPAPHDRAFADDPPDAEPLQALPETYRPIEYAREIRYVDAQLDEFFTELDAEGLLEDTIVVLTSDHGDEFLEHGALVHGPSPHREVLHVPLVIWGPGVAAGRRIAEALSLTDLMPTLLELVGAPQSPGAHGRKLARWIRVGTPGSALPTAPIFSEARASIQIEPEAEGVARHKIEIPVFTAQLGTKKLVRHPNEGTPRYAYFDLALDPGATEDRWDPDDPEAMALRDLLERHIRDSESERAARLEASATPTEQPEALDPERIEKLRALGYLE